MSLLIKVAKESTLKRVEISKVDRRTIVSVILGSGFITRLFNLKNDEPNQLVLLDGLFMDGYYYSGYFWEHHMGLQALDRFDPFLCKDCLLLSDTSPIWLSILK
jgi:hypothetical protein